MILPFIRDTGVAQQLCHSFVQGIDSVAAYHLQVKASVARIIQNRGILASIQQVAATYNLPAGPQIVTVTEGSCAETAGLQPRDIILQFEDREISSFTDLSAALAKQKAGDTVTLKIYRAGAELEITLTLDERPGESEIDATEQQAQAELEGQTAPDTDTDIPDFGGFEGYGYDYDMD